MKRAVFLKNFWHAFRNTLCKQERNNHSLSRRSLKARNVAVKSHLLATNGGGGPGSTFGSSCSCNKGAFSLVSG